MYHIGKMGKSKVDFYWKYHEEGWILTGQQLVIDCEKITLRSGRVMMVQSLPFRYRIAWR